MARVSFSWLKDAWLFVGFVKGRSLRGLLLGGDLILQETGLGHDDYFSSSVRVTAACPGFLRCSFPYQEWMCLHNPRNTSGVYPRLSAFSFQAACFFFVSRYSPWPFLQRYSFYLSYFSTPSLCSSEIVYCFLSPFFSACIFFPLVAASSDPSETSARSSGFLRCLLELQKLEKLKLVQCLYGVEQQELEELGSTRVVRSFYGLEHSGLPALVRGVEHQDFEAVLPHHP